MFKSMTELIRFRADVHPARPALVFTGETFSYRQFDQDAERAAVFLSTLGLEKGDHFAMLGYNSRSQLSLVFGAARLGVVPVILNWRLTPSELDYILEDGCCRMLFFSADFEEQVSAIRASTVERRISLDELNEGAVSLSGLEPGRRYIPEPDDDFILLYTSGTTGNPKGARITHYNMLSFAQQLVYETPHFGCQSKNLVCAPFFHIAGIGYFMFGLMSGATNYLLPRFEPGAVLDTVERQRISHMLLVPAMQQAVVEDPRARFADFSSLRHILYGASPISEPLLRRARETFKCDFTQGYGLTETTGLAIILRYDDHLAGMDPEAAPEVRRRLASAGRAAPGIQIDIVKPDGSLARPGEKGEVCIRGATVMKGYWGRPDANAKVFDSEGRLHTGDVGYRDDAGYVFLLDRLNDLIITKGEKVYPIEVERALSEHPEVGDVAVIGIPDDTFGEAVCAVLVSRNGTRYEAEAIRSWARSRLASYKLPRCVEYRAALPRTPSGKVLRRELRKPYWQGQDRQVH